MCLVIRSPQELQTWRRSQGPQSIGFVPTMGALHEGHQSLLQISRQQNDLSILSIFVNPTQFNDKRDLEKYPVTWESDLKMAEKNNVDVLFAPTFEMMYPDQYQYKISESDLSKELCGHDRPGHFDGVLTVVMRLFQLVQPDRAYFGEKDFQQLALIQGMAKAFFLNCEIIPVPTVREADGLAMSSRNSRLSVTEREKAPRIYNILKNSRSSSEAQQQLEEQGWSVDYVHDRLIGSSKRRFVAVRVGEVRLIDNVEL
ncbi:MAG: pantoate--beta-alanine ligase [Bdellovibrio sp. CG10_big_fil_rev_8_21_14_0_10_47_8]|nr:MAG: pantoate--beta-alanine ligase [Bdellovibrio sp. CG10_big_fil_rev_8_21_14_0_10_47_8]